MHYHCHCSVAQNPTEWVNVRHRQCLYLPHLHVKCGSDLLCLIYSKAHLFLSYNDLWLMTGVLMYNFKAFAVHCTVYMHLYSSCFKAFKHYRHYENSPPLAFLLQSVSVLFLPVILAGRTWCPSPAGVPLALWSQQLCTCTSFWRVIRMHTGQRFPKGKATNRLSPWIKHGEYRKYCPWQLQRTVMRLMIVYVCVWERERDVIRKCNTLVYIIYTISYVSDISSKVAIEIWS